MGGVADGRERVVMSKSLAVQAVGEQATGVGKDDRRQMLSIRRLGWGRDKSTERMGRGCRERGQMPGRRGHPLSEQMEHGSPRAHDSWSQQREAAAECGEGTDTPFHPRNTAERELAETYQAGE